MRVAIGEWAVEAGGWLLTLALPLYAVVVVGSLISLFAWRLRRPLVVVAGLGGIACSTGLWFLLLGRSLDGFGWTALFMAVLLPVLLIALGLFHLALDGPWSVAAIVPLHFLALLALSHLGRWLVRTDEERRWRAVQPSLPGFEPPTRGWRARWS